MNRAAEHGARIAILLASSGAGALEYFVLACVGLSTLVLHQRESKH